MTWGYHTGRRSKKYAGTSADIAPSFLDEKSIAKSGGYYIVTIIVEGLD